MAKTGEYNIEDIYQGGPDSFKPNYGDVFTGYHMPASSLGTMTNPGVVNQITELNKVISQGVKPVEVGVLSPAAFEAIPKQHFKEMNRMSKLTGTELTMHAPIQGFETSGIDPQGGGWSEKNRKATEAQLLDVVDKAHDLNDKGNVPITVHSANIPGVEWIMEDGEKKAYSMSVINQDTGQMTVLKEDIKYYPDMPTLKEGMEKEYTDLIKKYQQRKISQDQFEKEKSNYLTQIPLEKGKHYTPEKQLELHNHSEWDNSLGQLAFNKEQADSIIQSKIKEIRHILPEIKKGKLDAAQLNPVQRDAYNSYHNAEVYLDDLNQQLSGLFSKAYKYGDENKRKILTVLSEGYKKDLNDAGGDPLLQSRVMQNLIHNMKDSDLDLAPKTMVSVTDFAREKSADTFSNAALYGLKKYGDKAPVISIENLYPGFAFSTGKEMDKLISESKNKFSEKLMKPKKEGGFGLSKKEADKKANKLIGLTFDAGHLNLHRKHGFEEKDLLDEFKAMKKHITHLHLTDNFGHHDSHLPQGMGNVPTAKYLEELEKSGDLKKIKTILESGGFMQHFGAYAFVPNLEAFGSSMYSDGAGPYWNQAVGLQQGYNSGMAGNWLPQVNYETFGAGFSNLPMDLGGNRGGGGSRMSGRPME